MVIFISNLGIIDKLTNIKFHDKAIKKHLKEKNISHYLFKYDLLEYNFKDINESFGISYFSKKDFNDNFIDSDELKKYESIENDTKNKISILIKKFKLRVSILKNIKFSNEIVVSDDFEFDVTNLSHAGSLIKIAIVNENLENWMNCGNLKNYDVVFTNNKKFQDSLKEVSNKVFIVKGDSVYLRLKNILNLLYRRKNEKFHHVIFNRFNRVFPKYKDYFKVLDSEYFDDEWYKKEYELADNTDSAVHFLLVGYKKNYDPSPNFSISEYYECNKDIESEGVNPLIHYEKFGKKENRIIHISQMPKRDYNVILNSSYFDKEWYRKTYDIPDDVDCAEHYLNVGFLKGCDPSPNFSTYEYYEANSDVRNLKMNPLIHYELYGKKENRKLFLSDRINQENYDFILKSCYFDEEWYKNKYNIPDDVDCVEHYLKIGFAKLYNPSNEFNTFEYYECNIDVKEHIMNPLLHYEKYGRKENRKIHI